MRKSIQVGLISLSTANAWYGQDMNGTIRAVCAPSLENKDSAQSSIWIDFKQLEDAPATMNAFLSFPDTNGSYSLELREYANIECQGKPLTTVGPVAASGQGRGKLSVQDLGRYRLSGADTIIGSHVSLIDAQNFQVACCEIKEHRQFWREKRASEDTQIDQ